MKKYEIEINNEVYRVSVKELSADADMSDSQSVSDTDTKNPKSTEPATTPVAVGDGTEIKAPMAGTILNINVSVGQNVSQGDTLVVLEAMKMENEIVASCAGTVSVKVKAGDTVDTDQLLAEIK